MVNSSEAAAGLVGLMWLVFILVCGVGWVMNVYKLTQCDFETPYKTEVIRVVSTVVPVIGGFTGWMEIGEEVGKPKK